MDKFFVNGEKKIIGSATSGNSMKKFGHNTYLSMREGFSASGVLAPSFEFSSDRIEEQGQSSIVPTQVTHPPEGLFPSYNCRVGSGICSFFYFTLTRYDICFLHTLEVYFIIPLFD